MRACYVRWHKSMQTGTQLLSLNHTHWHSYGRIIMFSSWLHCLFLHTPTYNTGQHESNYNFRYSMQWLILNLEKIQSETVCHHPVHNITKPWLKTVGLIQKTFILFDLSVWLNDSRYLNSFNFCGMFWPIAPTAACGTCCQRVNCVGSLNVHHHVAFIAWSFLLGFCMAVLKSLISVHLADLGSSVFGLACPCCYEAVIQMVNTSIHSVSLYILLVSVYPVGWKECF